MPEEATVSGGAGHRPHQERPRMNKNFLAHTQGDAINALLATAGYNFLLNLKWIAIFWLKIWVALSMGQAAKMA